VQTGLIAAIVPVVARTAFDGGRGEPARLVLYIGGIGFEDYRIASKDWPASRDKTPFLALPTLEVDGKVVSQSNSINR